MLRIGLTGGIGSGKSTVAKVFETLGIPVYYADEVAKQIMNSDPALKESIIQYFGAAAYKDGTLDRKYLAAIVFNNKEKLDLLNSLVHPATIRDSKNWMAEQQAPYAIREAALLFESGAADNLDFVIGVYAPRSLRIQRVIKRDGLTVEEIEKRISRQINEEMKMKLCDAVIRNDEQELVIPQVIRLHERMMEMSRIKKSKVKIQK
ncbi:MAG: dephospho-CoA kinase [Sphingobacteriales bacterium]|nr:dephospho-CoA kinase [Sphingobacteriales bacterium]